MNKKLGIIIGVIVVLLILGGGGYYLMHKSMSSTAPTASSASQQTSAVFSSIQEALMNHLSLSCDYTSGNTHTIAYIKNGMIRADITNSTDPAQSGSVIMKDKTVYYWNAKMAMKMTMPEVTGTMPSVAPTSGNSGSNTMQSLEQYKQYCKAATVADSEFDLPTNVTFTDETQMMHAMPSMTMPTGTSGSNSTYQQQAQQYMQQYHVTPQGQSNY